MVKRLKVLKVKCQRKRETGNGKRETGNGKRGTGNGKRETGNGKDTGTCTGTSNG